MAWAQKHAICGKALDCDMWRPRCPPVLTLRCSCHASGCFKFYNKISKNCFTSIFVVSFVKKGSSDLGDIFNGGEIVLKLPLIYFKKKCVCNVHICYYCFTPQALNSRYPGPGYLRAGRTTGRYKLSDKTASQWFLCFCFWLFRFFFLKCLSCGKYL